jgi:hypothetical protein
MADIALPVLIAATVIAGLAILLLLTLFRRRAPRRPAPAPAGPLAYHQQMTPGREYMIVQSFTDFDGALRSAGERWVFKGYDFLPYDDGLTLFTDPGPGVRLQWRRETQGEIIDRLAEFIRPV